MSCHTIQTLRTLMAPTQSVQFSAHRKDSQRICRACGGHLTSMNFTPRNWEEYYVYSLRMAGKLCLPIGVRTLPLLLSRPIHRPHDLHKFDSR
jgi:hypothetical protein